MITCDDLRSLLGLAHGPAVDRVRRDPEGGDALALSLYEVAAPYLPRDLRVIDPPSGRDVAMSLHTALAWEKARNWRLDLTDPGVVGLLKTSIFLACGFDPGPMGAGVLLDRGLTGWVLIGMVDGRSGQRRSINFIQCFRGEDTVGLINRGVSRHRAFDAPEVAAELDPAVALALAVLHILEARRT